MIVWNCVVEVDFKKVYISVFMFLFTCIFILKLHYLYLNSREHCPELHRRISFWNMTYSKYKKHKSVENEDRHFWRKLIKRE